MKLMPQVVDANVLAARAAYQAAPQSVAIDAQLRSDDLASEAAERQKEAEALQRELEEKQGEAYKPWDAFKAFFGADDGANRQARDERDGSALGPAFLGPIIGTAIGKAIGTAAEDPSQPQDKLIRRDAGHAADWSDL